MAIVETTRPISGGVDTHLDVHVAAALDTNGGVLGIESFDRDDITVLPGMEINCLPAPHYADAIHVLAVFPPEVFTAGIATALAVIYGVTLLSGLYPSWLASRLEPAEALRHE